MTSTAAIVLALAYLAAAAIAMRASTIMTRQLHGRLARHALLSAVAAIFFAPSIVVMGHGAWFIGPAWLAMAQWIGEGWGRRNFWMVGVLPFVTTWFVLFAIFIAVSRTRPKQP
jgi:hypothetical protein